MYIPVTNDSCVHLYIPVTNDSFVHLYIPVTNDSVVHLYCILELPVQPIQFNADPESILLFPPYESRAFKHTTMKQ